MEELSNVLELARTRRNYLNFDIPEVKIIRDAKGKVKKFMDLETGKSEKMIENFMLITGTTIANHYSWLPFIYRVHESPNDDVIRNVIRVLRMSGYNLPKFSRIDEVTLKNILDHVSTSDEARVVRKLLLKSMKSARYDIDNVGHYALQLLNYCHFTSPIRRITDFRIHMLLDDIDTLDYSQEGIGRLEEELSDICKQASKMERVAQAVESEALAMVMAEYMKKHIGERFEGVITEIYPYGMFVKTNDLISGRVKFGDILSIIMIRIDLWF